MPDWRGTTPIGHDIMGSAAGAAGQVTNANEGLYGRSNGVIAGVNRDAVVNTNHNHSYNSPSATGFRQVSDSIPDGGGSAAVVTAVGAVGGGTTSSSGTAIQQYKRIGRVAVCSWIIKT